MGRHRTPEEKAALREEACALRAAGRSRREIMAELQVGDDLLGLLLAGTQVPDSLVRPQAKDELRAAAVALRLAGASYNEIVAELGVSKSSCSLWLRNIPRPEVQAVVVAVDAAADALDEPRAHARRLRGEGLLLREIAVRLGISVTSVHRMTCDLPVPPRSRHGGDKAHTDAMRRTRWDRAEAERAAAHDVHAARVAGLTSRELELAAVVAYICEGRKSKPWKPQEQVVFINSDPGLILLFLAWLDDVGFPAADRRFALSIHESADVGKARAWWASVVGVPVEDLGPVWLKHHNPKTVRKNVGDDYVGCLAVRLVQCRDVYRRIHGVWQGIMGELPQNGGDLSRVV